MPISVSSKTEQIFRDTIIEPWTQKKMCPAFKSTYFVQLNTH